MSRAKKAQKRKSELKKSTSEIKKKPINPFDLKYMKKKNASEPTKVVQGRPAVSRKRAMEIRKQTLGVEYQRFGKVNQIEDRRIGEKQKLSEDEKAEKRFMAQRQQMISSKKNRFNLNDDEDSLTHLGQSLSSVAKYEKVVDSDDEGGLNEDVVALANFGGGSMTVKVPDDEGGERKLSRKEIIAEVISKSKHAKAIRKIARDEYDGATDRLDEQLKNLMTSGILHKPLGKSDSSKPANNDSYDVFFREIQMGGDQRAAAGTPHKTDEQKAAEHEKIVKKLEDDKVRRMDPENSDFINHESADVDVESVEVSSRQKRRDEKRGKDDFELRYDQSGKIILDEKSRSQLVASDEVTGEPTNPKKKFLYKLEEFDVTAKKPTIENIEKIGQLIPELFSLSKIDTDFSSRCMRALLRQKWKKMKKYQHKELDFSIVAYLKLAADLYPTSDRWHPVCTPSLCFALEVVTSARFKNCSDCARVLFICSILANWVDESKRYLPEVMATLQGLLMLAVKTSEEEIFPTMSFPITQPFRNMLYVDEKLEEEPIEPLSLSHVFNDEPHEETTELQIQVLRILFSIIQKFIELYAGHKEAFCAIFNPFLKLWKCLPIENYPEFLFDEAKEVQNLLEKKIEENSPITQLKRKTKQNIKILKMLEPEFEEDFDPERPRLRKDPSRKGSKAEQKKLSQILKREKRGAMKELRLDAKYLARVQTEEQQKISQERKEKTNKIMHSLQTQESEYKKKKLKKF